MIRTIKGKILEVLPPQVVIETNGVGYGIYVTPAIFDKARVNDEVFVHTHHHLSEGKEELYGFPERQQREFFELLLSVSGVGPKVALSVVGSNSLDVLRSAIAQGNADIFKNVSGIGRKIAERIIVDLKTKVGAQPDVSSSYGETYEALSALGYKPTEIKEMLQDVPTDISDVQEQLRWALKSRNK